MAWPQEAWRGFASALPKGGQGSQQTFGDRKQSWSDSYTFHLLNSTDLFTASTQGKAAEGSQEAHHLPPSATNLHVHLPPRSKPTFLSRRECSKTSSATLTLEPLHWGFKLFGPQSFKPH